MTPKFLPMMKNCAFFSTKIDYQSLDQMTRSICWSKYVISYCCSRYPCIPENLTVELSLISQYSICCFFHFTMQLLVGKTTPTLVGKFINAPGEKMTIFVKKIIKLLFALKKLHIYICLNTLR